MEKREMGRYTRKRSRVGKRAAVNGASPAAAVGTRASTAAAAGRLSRRKPVELVCGILGSYIQLRSRRVPVSSPAPKKPVNSGGGAPRLSRLGSGAAELERISRLSSEASCAVVSPASGVYLERTSEREGTPTSCAAAEQEAEMEEFFAAAEAAERRRFAEKYNYDVENDVPLDGRYEWAPVEP